MSRLQAARAAIWVLLSQPALSHMEIQWPYPLRSKFNPAANYNYIDYSMTSPLSSDGSDYPCKGHHIDRPHQPTATYTAGGTYNMTLAGSATHGGGSCQLSLSYDEGESFKVIKSMIGGCPLETTYDFTVPLGAPSGEALLAWTWQNYEGNREFYMNCAEVNILASNSRRRRLEKAASVEDLPEIWRANLSGVSNCTTAERENPVYPNPGPDVVYGNGLDSSSQSTGGDCDGTPQRAVLAANAPSSSPTAADPAAASTTTLTVSDCMDMTITITPSLMTTTTTLTPAVSTPAVITPTPVSTRTWTATTSRTARPTTVSTWSHAPSHTASSLPPYVTGDVNGELPCVPGTFICSSETSWYTCDYNDGSEPASNLWIYKSPRTVADGTMCITNLSPYTSNTQQYAQQAHVPAGYYRDDRIGRARPDGECYTEGSLMCTMSGSAFDICDHGGWVQMGPVAAGTTCQTEQIVASS